MTSRDDSAAPTNEPQGLSEAMALNLIRMAARRAPPALSERLREEWLADLAAQRRGIPRLLFAIGCCWATRVIALEFPAAVVSTNATTGRASIAGLVLHDASVFSRRTTALLLIVGLHVLVIYGFATGLGSKVITVVAPPIIGEILHRPRQPDVLPPPAQPTLRPSRDLMPKLGPIVPSLPDLNSPDSEGVPQMSIAPPQSPVPAKVNRIIGGPGLGFPNTEDFYPEASRRLGEAGVAAVRVCLDERGRITSSPSIAQSTGFSRLDESALKLARAGIGHYRVTTEDGRPVAYCFPYRIRFEFR